MKRWLVHTGRNIGFMGREQNCVDGLMKLSDDSRSIHVHREFCCPVPFIAGERITLFGGKVQGEVEAVDGERLQIASPCVKYCDATFFCHVNDAELVPGDGRTTNKKARGALAGELQNEE
jgi:hypothetical protein